MSQPTKAQRRVWGRIGGLTTYGLGKTNTAPARAAMWSKWEREADPEGVLDPEERQRRAKALQRAFMTRVAMKGVEARRRKR